VGSRHYRAGDCLGYCLGLFVVKKESNMGSKITVFQWRGTEHGGFCYVEAYAGESLLKALYTAWQCKRHSPKCIKIEWR